MQLKKVVILVIVAALTVGLIGCAQPAPAPAPPAPTPAPEPPKDQPVHLRFASWGLGSAWYVQAATIATAMRTRLPKGSTVDVLPFAGGTGNNTLVATGEAEMAISFNVSTRWAVDGVLAYDKAMPNLRGLVGGLDEFYVAIVASKKLDITSLKDIKDRQLPVRLVTVPKGGLGEYSAGLILKAYGISYDDLTKWGGSVRHTSFESIVSAFKDGQADLFIHTITVGHPSLTEIAVSTDIHFIDLEPAIVSALEKFGYVPATLPKGSFRGQVADSHIIGLASNLVATDKMPDDVAYRITKAVCESKEDLVKGHAAFAPFKPEEAWRPGLLGAPLHPGAEKYYRERGWIK
ncbi:MAG: TAXI family TRAP transporter solute-binding subunit [Bacillota bacterium]